MTILTKELQEKFAAENFNKIVLHGSSIGRFIGYIETDTCFCNVLVFPNSHNRKTIFIDAGLNITFIEENNPLYGDINLSLEREGCGKANVIFYRDVKNDPLFSSNREVYLQARATQLFNKIVFCHNNIMRIIGFSLDDYGNSYIAYDVKGNICYIDSMNQLKENTLSLDLLEYLEHIVPKKETLMFENLRNKEE